MVSKEEFQKFVKELIDNDPRNKDIKNNLNKSNDKIATFFIVFGFLTFIFVIGIPFIVIGIILSMSNNNKKSVFLSNHKEDIVSFLLKDIDFTFNKTAYISENIFIDSQMCNGSYDAYNGEDLLRINIPNDDDSKSLNNLVVCDLDAIAYRKDEDGHISEYSVFEGTFGHISFPFEFNFALCINSSYRRKDLYLQKVELEDIVFNKTFRILCSDQIEARYVLTPEMMEKLLNFRKSVGVIKITLIDNKMYFVLPQKKLFELGAMKANKVETVFDKFYDDIKTILDIVEELKTNNKIFKI